MFNNAFQLLVLIGTPAHYGVWFHLPVKLKHITTTNGQVHFEINTLPPPDAHTSMYYSNHHMHHYLYILEFFFLFSFGAGVLRINIE